MAEYVITYPGPPVRGVYGVSDTITDSNGVEWYCTVAGKAGGTAAFVDSTGGATAVSSVFGRTGVVVAASGDYAVGQVTGAAPLASPALTGTPTAPTPGGSDNSTKIATTAFVQGIAASGVESFNTRTGPVLPALGDYTVSEITGAAPLASPTFTGVPLAPTASPGTNTTQLASTAFVTAAVASGGGGTLTGDVTATAGVTTLVATAPVEQLFRQQSISQLLPPQESVYWNGQNLVDVMTLSFAAGGGFGDPLTVQDGTASHGSVVTTVSSLLAGIQVYENTADTQPTLALGSLLAGPGTIEMGPGGTTAPDIQLQRTAAATLTITGTTLFDVASANDGTAGHGAATLSVNPPAASIYGNSGDAHPIAQLSDLFGNGGVFFGPSTATADTSIIRTTANTLTFTAMAGSIFTGPVSVNDGTAGHGSIVTQVNTPLLSFFANSGDADALVQVGSFAGVPVVAFGAGGSSSPDVTLKRTVANTLTVAASTLLINDGTATHGLISAGLNAGSPFLDLFGNSGDAQPILTLVDLAGAGTIGFGPGGSTAADVTLQRSTTNTFKVTASAGSIFTGPISHNDGTAAHGLIATALNSPLVNIFGSASDADAALTLGIVSSNPTLGLGPGGSTAQDVTIARTAANTLKFTANTSSIFTGPININDGTAGHGLMSFALGGGIPAFNIYGNSGDTQPIVQLVDGLGAGTLNFGVGGTTATDVSLSRPATNQLKLTASAGAVFTGGAILNATANPLTVNETTSAPSGLTSNTNMVMTVYKGSGGSNYYLLFAWNDGGTVRYKYMLLTGTGTTWTEGTSLPT